jgi:creatinine amidohydrolase
MKKTIVLVLIILLGLPAIGQVTMRTRLLCSLTNIEIEDYLRRNDVIIVPIGPIEVNGANPVDVEYVGPLAYAIKIAEKMDALVLEHMVFSYPGGTSSARGTVYVSPSDYANYIKIIATSLLRQGFKTQIYITGHGPSHSFMDTFLFEFMAEKKIAVLHMTMGTVASNLKLETKVDRGATTLGAYAIVGRLNDVPLTTDLAGIDQPDLAAYLQANPERAQTAQAAMTRPPAQQTQQQTGLRGGRLNDTYPVTHFYSSPYDHGGVPKPLATTVEERERLAKQGVAYINEVVDKMDAPGILKALREQQAYVDGVVKKLGDLLPK